MLVIERFHLFYKCIEHNFILFSIKGLYSSIKVVKAIARHVLVKFKILPFQCRAKVGNENVQYSCLQGVLSVIKYSVNFHNPALNPNVL